MTTETIFTKEDIIDDYESIGAAVTSPGYIGDFPFLQVATLLAATAVLGILVYAVLFM